MDRPPAKLKPHESPFGELANVMKQPSLNGNEKPHGMTDHLVMGHAS